MDLIDRHKFPIGIEASAYTLEVINGLDPQWIAVLRKLCDQGLVEFIGSGYAQIIGTLVPGRVNVANLRIGNRVYEHLLGFRPRIVLVNEQAFSAGLISHYLNAGYQAIIMEWNNPARFHPEWDPRWRYLPQVAVGQYNEEIALVWNKSISFQKFQRYAHGEMELDEYIGYLEQHLCQEHRAFPFYGNDVEIFDFRPGRFFTEAGMHQDGEWKRIDKLFARLSSDERFQCVPVSAVLKLMNQPHAGNRLSLESSQHPIPVKKQEKYNITRWAVTGTHDLKINTDCWKIFNKLMGTAADEDKWKELCYLWSSDFRTHITPKRLNAFHERLEKFKASVVISNSVSSQGIPFKKTLSEVCVTTATNGRIITLENHHIKLELNCRRGLAVQALLFKQICSKPLCVTLPHGYYDDISMGADFYSGNLILETPGKPKITDLEPLEPVIEKNENGVVTVSGIIKTPVGNIIKRIVVDNNQEGETCVIISYQIQWKNRPMGSLRLGVITLNPEAFDPETLYYATHNGGFDLEKFALSGTTVNHGVPASFLVSANAALGVTGGLVILGDQSKQIHIEIDKTNSAAIGMITHRPVSPNYFFRHMFSLMEMDETSDRYYLDREDSANVDFEFTITARKGSCD
ncbi:hypothetical protein [Desulfocicer niacini]